MRKLLMGVVVAPFVLNCQTNDQASSNATEAEPALGQVTQRYTTETLEVENGTRTGGMDRSWGMLMTAVGNSVCWSNIDMDQATQVNVLYSNGEPTSSVDVTFNGNNIGSISLPTCTTGGAWDGNCDGASGDIPDQGSTPGTLCLVSSDSSGWTAGLNSVTLAGGDSGGGGGGGDPVASCTDGIQNQGELDVDCGGPCEACGGGNLDYEAETAVFSGAISAESGGSFSGYSGSGVADCHGGEGTMTFTVNPGAGTYDLHVAHTTAADRDMEIRVNGTLLTTHMFNSTGSWFSNWETDTISGVVLNDGNNTIELATNGGSGPNFDKISLVASGGGGGATCSDGIQNQGEGGVDCGGPCATPCATCSDGIQNQGETGVDCGGPNCSACSGGGGGNGATLQVQDGTRSGGLDRSWGMIMDSAGDSVCWSGVAMNGIDEVDIYYSNGEGNADTVSITYNGSPMGSVALPNCATGGGWEGQCGTVTASITDPGGTGTLCVVADAGAVAWVGALNSVTLNSSGSGSGATCSDNVQNQGETGVDCGGPCQACGGGGGGGGNHPDCAGAPNPGSAVVGDGLCVDGQPWVMKGVNYDPVRNCGYNGWQHWDHSATDAALMQSNGFNTIRTFGIRSMEPLWDEEVNAALDGDTDYDPVTCTTAADCPDSAHNVCTWDGNAGSNICRTGYITDAQLSEFSSRGIRVVPTVHIAGGGPEGEWDVNWQDMCGDGTADNPAPGGGFPSEYASHITRIANHASVIALGVGNEIRYNFFYTSDPGGAWSNCWDIDDVVSHANHVVNQVKALTSKPVSVSWGNTWDIDTKMVNITAADMISYQIYNQLSFDGIFSLHPSLSSKPFWISEFGADEYNSLVNGVDESAQAYGNVELFRQILDNATGTAAHRAVGGTLFSWSDGHYKAAGDACAQDVGGIAPGGGPHPDITFHEEFWGITDSPVEPWSTAAQSSRVTKQSLGELGTLFSGY